MSRESSTKISPWIFWGAVPLSIIPLFYSVPSAYEQIKSERVIEQYGAVASGTVVSHEQISGGRGCKSRVKVAYEVERRPYELLSLVCGTSPGMLPVGRAIDVRYVPGAPATAGGFNRSSQHIR